MGAFVFLETGTMRRQKVSRTRLIAVALLGTLAGCSPCADVTYTSLEVCDVLQGAPVTGAEVSFRATGDALEYELSETPERDAMPTNEEGRTLLPVFAFVGTESEVVFDLTIRAGELRETLVLRNSVGEAAAGEHFQVRVLDTQAQAPAPPVLHAVEGSNPVVLEVNAYVGELGVCDYATRDVVWAISSSWTPFVVSATVGRVPELFVDVTLLEEYLTEGVTRTSRPCPVFLGEISFRPGGFIAYGVAPFVNEYFTSATYCLTAEGAVTACDPE